MNRVGISAAFVTLVVTAAALMLAPAQAAAATRVIWVDPVRGSDARSGATAASALRTLTAAWNRIPAGRALTTGVTINVRAGVLAPTATPNYWENRRGTATAPITIRSADGPGRAQLPSINMFGVDHLTLDGVSVRSKFDTFHCEQCSHLTLTRSSFVGIGNPAKDLGPHETVKINQSSYVTITDSYLAGAGDNALDMVAVQHATIARNTIAHARDWCAYAKGGATDITFSGNLVHHCGTGGITIGQGTGLEFMVAPWLQYEAYGARVYNNVVRDTEGAALGVNGAFAVLVAYNTAYRTGTRDHALEVVFGERSCDGNAAECAARRAQGGWGPSAPGGDPSAIPSRQVALMHNLVYNPPGIGSQWTHFAVYGPRPGRDGVPDPARADDGLLIRGNAIENGPADLALGLGDDQGCTDAHPTCSPDAVRAANRINQQPSLVAGTYADIPYMAGDATAGAGSGQELPDFDWSALDPALAVPEVAMPSEIPVDRAGATRAALPWRPGAYVETIPSTRVAVTFAATRGSLTTRDGSVFTKAGTRIVTRGDWLEFTARAKAGSKFVAWAGACAGQKGPVCVVRASGLAMRVAPVFAKR